MNFIIDNPAILLLSGIIAMLFVFIKDKWVSNQAVGNECRLLQQTHMKY